MPTDTLPNRPKSALERQCEHPEAAVVEWLSRFNLGLDALTRPGDFIGAPIPTEVDLAAIWQARCRLGINDSEARFDLEAAKALASRLAGDYRRDNLQEIFQQA